MTKRTERRDGRFVRLNVAADELDVTPRTVKKYCEAGLLACERLPSGHWRVLRTSLNALTKSGRTDLKRL